jgi:hypothetical protein
MIVKEVVTVQYAPGKIDWIGSGKTGKVLKIVLFDCFEVLFRQSLSPGGVMDGWAGDGQGYSGGCAPFSQVQARISVTRSA